MENNFINLINKYFKTIGKPINNQKIIKLNNILINALYKRYMVCAVLKEHSKNNNITLNDYQLSKQLSPIINITPPEISNELNFYELFENKNTLIIDKSDIMNVIENKTSIKYKLDHDVLNDITNDLNKMLVDYSKNI